MNFVLFNGYTSYTIVPTVVQAMINEGVKSKYLMTTRTQYIKDGGAAKREGQRFIYFAYDSESVISRGDGWLEAKDLSNNEPWLIISLSKVAHKFYKKIGVNSYYLPMGYDDIRPKMYTANKEVGLATTWTMDIERESFFYYRYILALEVDRFMKEKYPKIEYSLNNKVKYADINKFYAPVIIGLNDIGRQTNMRCWEIPINACYMLCNNVIRKSDYPLKEKKHYTVFESVTHMLDKIKIILDNKDDYIARGEDAKKVALNYPISANVKKMVDKLGMR